jgi:hypothetical protein
MWTQRIKDVVVVAMDRLTQQHVCEMVAHLPEVVSGLGASNVQLRKMLTFAHALRGGKAYPRSITGALMSNLHDTERASNMCGDGRPPFYVVPPNGPYDGIVLSGWNVEWLEGLRGVEAWTNGYKHITNGLSVGINQMQWELLLEVWRGVLYGASRLHEGAVQVLPEWGTTPGLSTEAGFTRVLATHRKKFAELLGEQAVPSQTFAAKEKMLVEALIGGKKEQKLFKKLGGVSAR